MNSPARLLMKSEMCGFVVYMSSLGCSGEKGQLHLLGQVGELRKRGPVLLDARYAHVRAARGQVQAAVVERHRRARRAARQVQRPEVLQLAQVLRAHGSFRHARSGRTDNAAARVECLI